MGMSVTTSEAGMNMIFKSLQREVERVEKKERKIEVRERRRGE